MQSNEQIAHDLAIAYITNRYGVDVSGALTISGSDGNVSGYSEVTTEHFPDVDEIKKVKVGTGEKGFMGLVEKKKWVEAGYSVDEIFISMIVDYKKAYKRILGLLNDGNG
jgi:hypothetical protein